MYVKWEGTLFCERSSTSNLLISETQGNPSLHDMSPFKFQANSRSSVTPSLWGHFWTRVTISAWRRSRTGRTLPSPVFLLCAPKMACRGRWGGLSFTSYQSPTVLTSSRWRRSRTYCTPAVKTACASRAPGTGLQTGTKCPLASAVHQIPAFCRQYQT